MKTAKYLQVFTGMVVAMGLGMAPAEAKKADFMAFEGKFKGTPNAIIYSNLPMTATANMTVKVPKSGKTATVTVIGTATYLGMTYPIFNTIVFEKSTVVMSDVVFNLLATVGSYSGAVALNKKGTALNYNIFYTPTPSYAMNGTMSIRPQGKKKKKLTLTFQINTGGNIYSYVFTGSAKVKPEK